MNNQKIILITGAAVRIGSKIAHYFAINNCSVIIHYYKSKDKALELQKHLIELTHNPKIFIKHANLNIHTDIIKLIEEVNTEIGMIDILINNAAIFENDNIENFDLDSLKDHLNINLIAPLLLIQSFIDQYKLNKGNIINILDYAIIKPPKNFLSYIISKSSLWTATQMIAQMVAPNIRVNAIGPGPTLANISQSEKSFNDACSNTLLKKGSTTQDICNAIDYILKTESITGQLLMLDSGRHISNYDYC